MVLVASGALAAQLFGGTSAGAVSKKPTKKKVATTQPAAGKVCTKVGARAPGTSLDCVKVGKALQWQRRGSKLNPFHLNEVGEYTAYEGNRYRLKVTGIATLTVEDIKPGGTGKYPIPAGFVPVKVGAELTYLGPKESNDLPASITALVLVDANGRKFETYAGDDKAGGECSQFGEVDQNNTRHLDKDSPLTSGLCVVVPATSVGPLLLLNLSWLNEPNGIWFKTTA